MQRYTFTPRGVCSSQITFALEDGKLHDVQFRGGCNGNLKAIGKLVEGKDAKEIEELLLGNDCNGRGTSCADQLARAIGSAIEYEAKNANA